MKKPYKQPVKQINWYLLNYCLYYKIMKCFTYLDFIVSINISHLIMFMNCHQINKCLTQRNVCNININGNSKKYFNGTNLTTKIARSRYLVQEYSVEDTSIVTFESHSCFAFADHILKKQPCKVLIWECYHFPGQISQRKYPLLELIRVNTS